MHMIPLEARLGSRDAERAPRRDVLHLRGALTIAITITVAIAITLEGTGR